MKDWLVKLAEMEPTDEQQYAEAVAQLPLEDLLEIANDRPETVSEMDTLAEKMAHYDQLGREMAHQHGEELMKTAFSITEKGHEYDAKKHRLLARQNAEMGALRQDYQSMAGIGAPATLGSVFRFGFAEDRPDAAARHHEYVAKKHEEGKNAWNPLGGMLTPSSHEEGGTTGIGSRYGKSVPKPDKKPDQETEKKANVMSSLVAAGGGKGGKLLSGAAQMMQKNPTKALAIGGAAVGAVNGLTRDPGVDPATGQPRSRLAGAAKGAIGGGALGAAAGHFAPKAVGGRVQAAGKQLGGAVAAHTPGPLTQMMPSMPAAGSSGNGVLQAKPGMMDRLKARFAGPKAQPSVPGAAVAGPEWEQNKVAKEKLAMLASMCGSSGGGDTWLSQFEGTPLMEKAIALEEQELQMEMAEIQKRQQDAAESEARMQESQARWAQVDQLNLQRRVLALELAKYNMGADSVLAPMGGAPQGAAPPAPDQGAQPSAPPAPADAPQGQPDAGQAKVAYRF
jgi:DNA-binding protein H-NS